MPMRPYGNKLPPSSLLTLMTSIVQISFITPNNGAIARHNECLLQQLVGATTPTHQLSPD